MTWPGFGYPLGAAFFLALIPLVILYFLKLKRPRVEIPSLALWSSVVNDQRVNSPFQTFKRNMLLLLQLILLTLIILALMQPFLPAGSETSEYIPVLVDCSASMSATVDESGKTRLDVAKEQAAALIESLRSEGRLALFSFATSGRRLTEFTNERSVLYTALEQLEVTDRASSLDEVLRMADAYSRTAPVKRVVVLTDAVVPDQVDFDLPFELDIRRIEAGGNNVGITEMSARRSGPESWDVFVRVSGSSVESMYGELQLKMDGKLIGKESIVVSSDESERLVFEVDSRKATLLEASLTTSEFDSMASDNSVFLSLPETRPLKIRTSDEMYSWQHALNVMEDLEIEFGGAATSPEYDLVISDSEDLKGVTAPVTVFNGVIPSDIADLVEVQEVDSTDRFSQIVDWTLTAPLLRHVRLRDVELGEKTAFINGGDTQALEERGFETLIHGADGPLMLQRRRGLETDYYFLFNTDRSTLPYRIAFPILATNIVQEALQQASLSDVRAAATGVLPELSLKKDTQYTIVGPNDKRQTLSSSPNGMLSGVTADAVGRYDVLEGSEVVASVGTGLLSNLETTLSTVDTFQFSEVEMEVGESQMLEADTHLWWTLAIAAFVFLLLEWWYFQRVKTRVSV